MVFGNGFHTLYVSILRYKAIPGTSHTFYDIVNRYTRIPVADPLLCCMFPLDGLLWAAVDTRYTVFAAVLKFRFFIFQYNIPAGADPLANTAADTSIIHMKSCVSVQFIIRIKLIKHSVPDMEPNGPLRLAAITSAEALSAISSASLSFLSAERVLDYTPL